MWLIKFNLSKAEFESLPSSLISPRAPHLRDCTSFSLVRLTGNQVSSLTPPSLTQASLSPVHRPARQPWKQAVYSFPRSPLHPYPSCPHFSKPRPLRAASHMVHLYTLLRTLVPPPPIWLPLASRGIGSKCQSGHKALLGEPAFIDLMAHVCRWGRFENHATPWPNLAFRHKVSKAGSWGGHSPLHPQPLRHLFHKALQSTSRAPSPALGLQRQPTAA